ncbi:MAG: peptidase M14 [Candidatus Hydrogenedentes bacterium]|nr:peptidase M14 [Candidatus Hydrogenedentota bacterium]
MLNGLLSLLLLAPFSGAGIEIHADYPGANIAVARHEDDTVYLSQELRDTSGWWFYWNFGADGAPGETVTFRFTDGNVIGTRGPAISTDAGATWRWLGTDTVEKTEDGVLFRYTFDGTAPSVRFAFAPPYQAADLDRFLARQAAGAHLAVETLCESEKGRPVPRVRIGRLDGGAEHRLLLTARHHSCESMASYVLEGLMAALLGDGEDAAWFRANAEALVIPMVDMDGVEDGDQGKNRIPRDHGRDYQGDSIYKSTRAIRETAPGWSEGRLRLVMDFHCPHIRGGDNERIYQVGRSDPAHWAEQQRFAGLLAGQPNLPLPYAASNDLPFGESWNQPSNYTAGAGIFQWAAGLDGVRCATAFEIPYANAGEATITPDNARAFGAAMIPAIRAWLE